VVLSYQVKYNFKR